MTTRRGSAGKPRRTPSTAAVRKDVLAFVEGNRTEEDYLVFWHRKYRRQVTVKIDEIRGTPLKLVRAALDAKRLDRRRERRGQGRAYDEIWCMFDVDEHPSIAEASHIAAENDIRVAVSNPCIELWFLLHFRNQTAFIDRRAAQREAASLLQCDKLLSTSALEALFERFDEAKTRAIALEDQHARDGSPVGTNPSSGAWQIVETIRRG